MSAYPGRSHLALIVIVAIASVGAGCDWIHWSGKQRAVDGIEQTYPDAKILRIQRVHSGWGEGPGEWSILFETKGEYYRTWYSIDGEVQHETIRVRDPAAEMKH